MYRSPGWPSTRARRSAAIRTLRLLSATNASGHTSAISSDLLTTSPGRSTRAIRRSKARPLTETGSLPFSKSRLAWSSRNGPKNISSSEGSFSRSIVWISNAALVPGGDLCGPPRDSEPVIVISRILWLAISERDSSLRKLKSISKREDTISDCACLSANRLAFGIVGMCAPPRRLSTAATSSVALSMCPDAIGDQRRAHIASLAGTLAPVKPAHDASVERDRSSIVADAGHREGLRTGSIVRDLHQPRTRPIRRSVEPGLVRFRPQLTVAGDIRIDQTRIKRRHVVVI